ncbi:hypothetical protein L208DRAFT_1235683 [Tricholoma matsutake]|nr:hypothetical protein L208DRAFT_1235683 [Tricholoma matsutake 945]
MPKRTIDDLADSINMDRGLIDGLLQFDRDELAALFAHIANEAKTPTAFKKARIDLPSFSAKWSDLAPQFGLSPDIEQLDLETFTTPKYYLPPSLHEAMFENAWRWQDVYREKVDQTREEARVRILDPYIVPIVALFQGRVVDKPEQAMLSMKSILGLMCVDSIFMIGGILFFIIEFKLGMPDGNPLAQLFLEFLSAAEANKSIDFKGLRIYGLLTNLIEFKFYSYDPSTEQFCFDETIFINIQRTIAFADMMNVSNKIFGVVLSAYMDGLRASITKSKDRVKRNNVRNPSALSSEGKNTGGRKKSTDRWEAALALAESCRNKFEEPVASHQDIEDRANEALGFLTQSVRSIPRASTFTGGDDDPSTPAELKALATRVTKERHERYLSKLEQ